MGGWWRGVEGRGDEKEGGISTTDLIFLLPLSDEDFNAGKPFSFLLYEIFGFSFFLKKKIYS